MIRTRLRAFVLGGRGFMGGSALHAWLNAGHAIAGYWSTDRKRDLKADRRLGWMRPERSVSAALRRARVSPQLIVEAGGMAELGRALAAAAPDVLICMGFASRLRRDILDILPGRCINLHPTLLPACRGPAPTLALLFEGRMDVAGGVTLHVMDDRLDTGPVIAALVAPTIQDYNPLRYSIETARLAGSLLTESLPRYLAGNIGAMP